MELLVLVVMWLVLVGPIVTLIHELGHAVAALALGRRVHMLAVGHRDDVTVTLGGTVLRFGRSVAGRPSGFVLVDPESSPDEAIAIALLGPLANLGTAPLFAAAAQSGATSGLLEAVLWQLAAMSLLIGIGTVVPYTSPETGILSDGRQIHHAWAMRTGRPLPVRREPDDRPEPRTRWPFLFVLALVVVLVLLAGGVWEASLVLALFGYVALKGGHRTRAL